MTQEPTAGEALELASEAFNLAGDLSSGHFAMADAIAMIERLAAHIATNRAPASVAAEGEAVAWRWRIKTDLVDTGWNLSYSPNPSVKSVGLEVRALYAHPARMPTRRAAEDIIRSACSEYLFANNTGPVKTRADRGEDAIKHGTDALIALFTDTRGA